jgi:predicted transposase/invertase (TIGR01784 family)
MKNRGKTHIFDKLFKQLMHLSKKSVIHFINGLFGASHPLTSTLSYSNTEYVGENLKRLVSDMVILIGGCRYQIEAQISDDLNMAVRVFRYGFEESLRSKRLVNGEITLPFPQVRVIYWETTRKTPDTLTLNLVFPNWKLHKYRVKAFKFLDHSIAELEQRKMAILLPFYVLKLRKQVQVAKTDKRFKELSEELEGLINELADTAERSAQAGALDQEDIRMVLEHLEMLHNELYRGYTKLEGVDKMLQERILTYSEKMEIKVRRQERRKSRQKELITARNFKDQGVSSEIIAAATGLPLKKVQEL